jgi:UDPglucose--hexose-1-phosphate uridylyltransferase
MKTPEGPHRRWNPLLDEWVLCSPHRLKRPWQGQVDPPAPETRPAYDPACYLCPGNPRAGGETNPAYEGTYVFTNDFSALLPEDTGVPAGATGDELFRTQGQRGLCKVICFSPRHDLTLPQMDTPSLTRVVATWAAETREISRLPWVRYVQVFENKGAMMGCSNPHPHCQIWASEHVPANPEKRRRTQRAYFDEHGRDLLGDYLDRERATGERIVCENAHFTALVPFWAVWPFETMIVARRPVADLPSLSGEEQAGLADVMRRLCVRYDNLFACSFPYSMGFYQRPNGDEGDPSWRLHAAYFPPLLRSASVRKFLVGYELTAEPQRDLGAEQAASRLRDMSERRFA